MARVLAASLTTLVLSFAAFARDLDKQFQKAKLSVGIQSISAWIADDSVKREEGLMFVEKMPEDSGMLFVFEDEQPLNFWMKNTVIPLAIGYFNAKGVLIDMQEMKVTSSLMDLRPPTYESRGPALFALEMNAGWFARHKIKIGARLRLNGPPTSKLLADKLKVNRNSRH